MNTTEQIGFIGQGWIGKHYANDFESRGYSTVRYALEEPYVHNKEKIANCDITFIAVPTPTTPEHGCDSSYLEDALSNIGNGKIAVIKSTTSPGMIYDLQGKFPDCIVLHSPEFLREKSAAYDAAHPDRNIIGVPKYEPNYIKAAQHVLSVLPHAPYKKIMLAHESELVKYAGNCFLYTKVVFMNILYDLVATQSADWETIREAITQDPRIGKSHTQPVHTSGHLNEEDKTVRGAGGHCFIKDFEAFRQVFDAYVDNHHASEVLDSLIKLNNKYLSDSNKDIDLLSGVYGNIIPGSSVKSPWYHSDTSEVSHLDNVQSSSIKRRAE